MTSRLRVMIIIATAVGVLYSYFFTFFWLDVKPLPCGESNGSYSVSCAFTNPEDVIRSGVKDRILVSEFQHMWSTGASSAISSFNLATGEKKQLYPATEQGLADQALWGEASCNRPPESFEPHGIDLITREDGTHMLLAVSHGKREAIEMFEYYPETDAVAWRGCVVSPDGYPYNDVAGTPGGGFYATSPFALVGNSVAQSALKGILLAEPIGYAVAWDPHKGYRPLLFTQGRFPNGLAYDAANHTLFINQHFAGDLVKYDLTKQTEVGREAVPRPDNLNWSQQGTLLVASHLDYLSRVDSCLKTPQVYCPVASTVYDVDPDTLTKRVVFKAEQDGFGFATSVIDEGDRLIVGTAAGTRMAIATEK